MISYAISAKINFYTTATQFAVVLFDGPIVVCVIRL